MDITRLLRQFSLCVMIILIGCGDVKKSGNNEIDTLADDVPPELKTHSNRTKIYSPKRELAGFKVPEGFIVELVASEEDGIVNPIDLTFDDAGRLWTQTAVMYPLDPVANIKWQELLRLMDNPQEQEKDPNFRRILDLYRGETKGKDKILVLSDLYEGSEAKVDIWADGLAIPQSILPYKNGSYVAQGSEMFFLADQDGDGIADKRTPLFRGFGFTDTHTMSHTLLRGPGDWIHFSHGALNKGEITSVTGDARVRIDYSKIARFSLDGKQMEVINAGLNNIWGFQLRGNGQWYATEANDLGYSVVPMEVGTGYPGIGNDRLRTYQPFVPELHEFRVGGTGISGLAFADDVSGSFPEEWKNVAFLANPITSKINAVRIIRNPNGSVTAEHLPDFLTSQDDWFRPVNMEFGPDGCLYIADWYNKIISHNELPTTHPDRDKSHGRIWRIRHESQKLKKIPNLYEVNTPELVGHLKSPSLWEKRAAWHQISDRPLDETKELSSDLVALVGDPAQDELTRILALWSLEGIRHYDQELLKTLLGSNKGNLRREAVRSLTTFSLSADELAVSLKGLIGDPNAMVRSQVLRTLDEANTANGETIGLLVEACKPALGGNAMGSSYERNFERYLARKALEKYPEQLSNFIKSSKVANYNVTNLIWASQALPKQEKEAVFLNLWKRAPYKQLDEPTFILVAEMLDNNKIYNAVGSVLESTENAQKHVTLAIQNQAQIQSGALTRLLALPVKHLLQSGEKQKQHLGLEAVGKLKMTSLHPSVLPLVREDAPEETLQLALFALKDSPAKYKTVFESMANNGSLDLPLRADAIQALAISDMQEAEDILKTWVLNLRETEQTALTQILSNSPNGIVLLKQLYEKKSLDSNVFDLPSAEKVFQADEGDAQGKQLFEEVQYRIEGEKKAFEKKLERFIAIAEKGSGNAAKGEKLFQTCLLCHAVGGKGYDFAPALDGSALRENEALLTAILDPDAAMESSYAIYRVVKKDGAKIEGYLVRKDERGTTIGFMGGGEQFIQKADITSEGYLGGRSFMPKGLIDNYSEDQVADLLAYIKTLN